MRSLAMQLTFVNSYIPKYKTLAKKNVDDLEGWFDDIDNLDEEDDDYFQNLRIKIKEIKKKFDKSIEEQEFNYKLLIEDLDDIHKQKHHEQVIYSMDTFAKFEKEFRELLKQPSKLVDKLETAERESKLDKKFSLSLSLSVLKSRCIDEKNRIKKVIDLLNNITGMKTEES